MIHTSAFDALPVDLKELVYRRLWDVLHHREPEKYYRGRREALRTLQILRETKKDLPRYWHSQPAAETSRRL